MFEVDAFRCGERKPLDDLTNLNVPEAFEAACAAGQIGVAYKLQRRWGDAVRDFLAGKSREEGQQMATVAEDGKEEVDGSDELMNDGHGKWAPGELSSEVISHISNLVIEAATPFSTD